MNKSWWGIFLLCSASTSVAVDFFESMRPSISYDVATITTDRWWQAAAQSYEQNIVNNQNDARCVKIPHIIHHIWLGSPFSEKHAKLVETWKALHPDWQFILWTEKEIEEFNLYNKKLYDASS